MNSLTRKKGFTIIEILVVLAISALLSSILFASFRSVSDGNKKSSCQNNLVQIYQATRLYAQDANGELPYLNPGVVTNNAKVPANGLGLWALYAYPASTDLDCDKLTSQLPDPNDTSANVPPLASYIRSTKFFHCPYDHFDKVAEPSNGCKVAAGTKLKTDVEQYTGTDNKTHLNPYYLSYQSVDDLPSTPAAAPINLPTYSSLRAPDSKRGLLFYKGTDATANTNPAVRSADNTIVAWCRFHRSLTGDGATKDKASNFDNVLFLDGTVQYLPTKQLIGTATCTGWQRATLEQASAANSAGVNACPTQ